MFSLITKTKNRFFVSLTLCVEVTQHSSLFTCEVFLWVKNTGGHRYMRSFYLRFCKYPIEKWPYSGTYPLIYSHYWPFQMWIRYMRAYFFGVPTCTAYLGIFALKSLTKNIFYLFWMQWWAERKFSQSLLYNEWFDIFKRSNPHCFNALVQWHNAIIEVQKKNKGLSVVKVFEKGLNVIIIYSRGLSNIICTEILSIIYN